jgi:hypothetical protein
MSYIGKVELKASDIRTSGVITISGGATNTVALGGSAPSVQTVVLTVNGVTQATNTYTIAGSTLTLSPITDFFADGDTVEAITINDIGTTITPADGTVTLPKISAGTGTVGQYLKTDGVNTLSWSTVASAGTIGDITTANNFFQNWNTIDVNTTSTFATSINAAIIGPITVTGSFVWTVSGILNIL